MSEMTVTEATVPSGTPLTDLVERASALAHRMGEARWTNHSLSDSWSAPDGLDACIVTLKQQKRELVTMAQWREDTCHYVELFISNGTGHKHLLDLLLRYHHEVGATRPSWIDVMRAAELALSEVQ